MNFEMIITLSLLAGAAALFVSGKVRSDLVAVCSLILLVLFGILSPSEALSGFSNSVVIMMIGLFIVGGGIFQTGLAKMASGKMLKLAGTSETRLLLMVMGVTALIGAFVSNTGTVAVMLPIVVSLAMSANISPGRLLMPLAFASSLGGTLTLIGTPPNLVIRETLTKAGYPELSFFSFTPIGLVCLVVGIGALVVLSKLFLPKEQSGTGASKQRARSLAELARQYQLSQNLFRIQVQDGSPVIGRTLLELDIPNRHQVHIIEIRRRTSAKNPFFKTINQEIAGPATVIQERDILYVHGAYEHVERFAKDCRLTLIDSHVTERTGASSELFQSPDGMPLGGMASDGKPIAAVAKERGKDKAGKLAAEDYASHEVGIAEVLIPPNSRFINQLVKESAFREKYSINILGIQRKGSYLLHQLKDEKFRLGDALLIQGTWRNIALLSKEQSDIVVVGQPLEDASKVTLDHKAPLAGGIMALMVVLMILEVFPAVVTVLIAAVLMVVTGCLRNMEEAYKTINWESIVLIGGMIPMSIAVEKTGAAALLSEKLVGGLGGFGPIALLAGIYFATSALTLFISNTACAILFAPIALAAAVQLGVSPLPFMFAVSIAASMCFAVPFSTPPNALVMSAGRYNFMDYVRIGLPLQVLLGIIMVAVLPLFFPF
ncbi:SLC13 family permease [Paenibacillaceae bacterium]|nr:SLC13 family permease [Paenibacillaceae bacterium]